MSSGFRSEGLEETRGFSRPSKPSIPPLPPGLPPTPNPHPKPPKSNYQTDPTSPDPICISTLPSILPPATTCPPKTPPSQIRQTGVPNRPNFTRSRDFPPNKSTTQHRARRRGLSLIFASPLNQQRPTGHRGENELTVPRAAESTAGIHRRNPQHRYPKSPDPPVTTIQSRQINNIRQKHPKTLDSAC